MSVLTSASHESLPRKFPERRVEKRSGEPGMARRERGLRKLINAPAAALPDPLASMERKKVIGHELYVNPYGSAARRNIRSGG